MYNVYNGIYNNINIRKFSIEQLIDNPELLKNTFNEDNFQISLWELFEQIKNFQNFKKQKYNPNNNNWEEVSEPNGYYDIEFEDGIFNSSNLWYEISNKEGNSMRDTIKLKTILHAGQNIEKNYSILGNNIYENDTKKFLDLEQKKELYNNIFKAVKSDLYLYKYNELLEKKQNVDLKGIIDNCLKNTNSIIFNDSKMCNLLDYCIVNFMNNQLAYYNNATEKCRYLGYFEQFYDTVKGLNESYKEKHHLICNNIIFSIEKILEKPLNKNILNKEEVINHFLLIRDKINIYKKENLNDQNKTTISRKRKRKREIEENQDLLYNMKTPTKKRKFNSVQNNRGLNL